MTFTVRYLGTRVALSCPGVGEGELAVSAEAVARWRAWAERYAAASGPAAPGLLLELGRELFAWLDEGGLAQDWLALGGAAARRLEVASAANPDAAEQALLDLPWELIANAEGPLAGDPMRPLQVWRRIGAAGEPVAARHRDLSLLFMAASPRRSGPRLAYEAEESAILAATERLGLSLSVEESGCPEFLGERLNGEERFEALHLSCHGDVLGAETAATLRGHGHDEAVAGPVLLLETPEGRRDFTSPGRLAQCWGEESAPGLVFLSACRTAEGKVGAPESYARQLVEVVPAVLGWDGSVLDPDATAFAEHFYRALAGHETPAYAAAVARKALLQQHLGDPRQGRHWHLARLYLGAGGGGALCAKGAPQRALPKDAGYAAFLDKAKSRVPVAGARSFVGRRREAQAALSAFRADAAPGVLLHGMGNLGKSSLAARIANRLPRLETVVIYQHYDPGKVLEQVVSALAPAERRPFLEEWQPRLQDHPEDLGAALRTLLRGPFGDRPVLLVVDDLEQVLEDPAPGRTLTPVQAAHGWAGAIGAILEAFAADRGASRLLLTSRYDFEVRDSGGADLAAALERITLTPFEAAQQDRQWRARLELRLRSVTAEQRQATEAALRDKRLPVLHRRALKLAAGNPGLQDLLSTPLLAGEFAAVEDAIASIEAFLASGQVPEIGKVKDQENAAFEFFRRMTFERYVSALSGTETALLMAASLFGEAYWPGEVTPEAVAELDLGGLPVPAAALDAVAAAAGIGEPGAARMRLVALGLLDAYAAAATEVEADGYALNRFARPYGRALDDAGRRDLARTALPALAAAWTDADGDWPSDPRAVEATRLMLLGGDDPDAAQRPALPAVRFLFDVAHAPAAALAIGGAVSDRVAKADATHDLTLLRRLAEAAGRIGDGVRREALLRRGLASENDDPRALAELQYEEAFRLATSGDPAAALRLLQTAAATFERLGDVRSRAVAMGQIADILQARGELEEALRIHQEEQLPVYERLGDVRARAVAMGKIADILQGRGELEEALRIRQEEELPVYERLGDVHSHAVTIGQIADILQARGELEEALRIRQEEELPVYERLGDVRARRHHGQDRRHPAAAGRARGSTAPASRGVPASGPPPWLRRRAGTYALFLRTAANCQGRSDASQRAGGAGRARGELRHKPEA